MYRNQHSNIQPLDLCVYRYPDNLELKEMKSNRNPSALSSINEFKVRPKKKHYSFSSFIPNEAPFVLSMIRKLVNSIENHSYSSGKWGNNAMQIAQIQGIDQVVVKIMVSSIIEGENIISQLTMEKPLPFKLSLFRKILEKFYPSLIHFQNNDLLLVTASPLYDSTMCPNPKFSSVVKHAVLRSSRTIIDTASFVMIHLFHIWEYSTNMQETKKDIVQNFGNLLVSFECRPKLIDRTDITPESCLLGIILETTTIQFWNSLTGHRVFEAFETTSAAEKKISRCVRKCNMFPSIPEIMNYDIPHLRMPIHYFFSSDGTGTPELMDSNTISSNSLSSD